MPLIVVTRDDPMRFVLYVLMIGLPYIAIIVPPGRLGVSIFDYSLLIVLIAELWRRSADSQTKHSPLFPSPVLMWVQLLTIPIVLMSQFPVLSSWIILENFLVYLFFLMLIRELQSADEGERLLNVFSISVIVLALGIFFQAITGINLSTGPTNPNQMSIEGGLLIYRPGGFFPDAQAPAQFLSCAGTLLLAMLLGHRFSKTRNRSIAWIATLLAFIALFVTISRSALLAAIIAVPFVIIFGTRGGVLVKALAILVLSAILVTVIILPSDVLMSALPVETVRRLASLEESYLFRHRIWFDTWNMFTEQPITGIGLGGFQSFLLNENPTMRYYMGIGNTQVEAYMPNQPESGYFKIFYEGGILGSLAALFLVIAALRRAFKVLNSSEATPAWKSEVVGALAALIIFGLSFATLFSIADERNIVIMLLPLAIIWSRSMALDAKLNVAVLHRQ
ncbi:MAG: O-antigen ligase family protein [Pseudomonadota bacterium]